MILHSQQHRKLRKEQNHIPTLNQPFSDLELDSLYGQQMRMRLPGKPPLVK